MSRIPICEACGQPGAVFSPIKNELGQPVGGSYHHFCYITQGEVNENYKLGRRGIRSGLPKPKRSSVPQLPEAGHGDVLCPHPLRRL